MSPTKQPICHRTNRSGAAVVIVIQMFMVALIFSFLAINLSNIQRQHAAGQVASDLASRWGVDLITRSDDSEAVSQQVQEMAQKNWITSDNLTGSAVEQARSNVEVNIEFGTAKIGANDKLSFYEGQTPVNSVRVAGQYTIPVLGLTLGETSELTVQRKATSVAIERDICLVIDRSGSMNWDLDTGDWSYDTSYHSYNPMTTTNDSYWNDRAYYFWWYWPHPTDSRWASMLPAIYGLGDELLETAQNEQLSIVSYSTDNDRYAYSHEYAGATSYYSFDAAEVEVQPTFDYSTAASFIENKFKWDQPVMGGTNISAGIDLGVQVLTGSSARPNAFKTLIVMTDGQHNEGRSPWLAAEDAAEIGVEVFTVTFSEHADQDSMILAAELGNGQHFHAPDGDTLEDIFKAIANIPPAALIE